MQASPRRSLIYALLVSAALAFSEPLRRTSLFILRTPFLVTKTAVQAVLLLPQLPHLARENASLKTALMQRDVELAQHRETIRHLQQGKALQEAAGTARGLIARVIGRSTIPTQHVLLLDKGSRDGLSLDSVVVDAEGVVGRVRAVQAGTALVMLVTDPESRIAGLIERSREAGLVVGQGRGRCDFIYLDLHADLQEGDRVMTAGLGGAFPKGLPIGKVVRVLRDEQAGVASAQLEPAAHLGRAEEVFCLLSGGSS